MTRHAGSFPAAQPAPRPRRGLVLVLSVAFALNAVLAGCSAFGGQGSDGGSPQAPVAASSPDVQSHHPSAAASPPGHGGQAVALDGPAEAALQLQSLIGQHSILVSDLMRSWIRGDADVAQAADAALGTNTEDLGELLQGVVGADGRKSFDELWAAHVASLLDYARGLSSDDPAQQRRAREELVQREEQLAELFSAASGGRLPRADALAAVRMHVDQLLAGATAYAERDYAKAARLYRHAYGHSYAMGTALARALLPQTVAAELDRPDVRLRSALTQLLGEHVALVVAAMRSSVKDSADFAAMGDAVNANTLDLTAAIESLFGAKAARGFQSAWADHVDALMTYTEAVVRKDGPARERARADLRNFEGGFAQFLDDATEQRLGRQTLAQAFVMHDRSLTAEIDAYAADEYRQAYEISLQTYADMFTMSGTLAGAIGSTLAARLPTGGSQTGGGGTAQHGPAPAASPHGSGAARAGGPRP